MVGNILGPKIRDQGRLNLTSYLFFSVGFTPIIYIINT